MSEPLTASPTGPEAEAATETPGASPDPVADDVLSDDLLVEEISIDGMCGVY